MPLATRKMKPDMTLTARQKKLEMTLTTRKKEARNDPDNKKTKKGKEQMLDMTLTTRGPPLSPWQESFPPAPPWQIFSGNLPPILAFNFFLLKRSMLFHSIGAGKPRNIDIEPEEAD